MISHKHKCIFIHIPKTGGTSVEKSLWTDFSRKNLFGRPNFTQTGVLHHLKAKHVRQKVGEDIFKQYFKFTFVRNPWSRVLSQYFYTIQVRKDFQRMLWVSRPKGRHYSEYYDQETTGLVEEIYWEDIERFNYGFETPG